MLLIGACMIVIALPILASAQPFGIGSQQALQKSQEGVLSSFQGRYVFGQISSSSKDKFMLDTRTGRLWRITESSRVGMFLTSVPYKTEDGEYSPFPDHAAKKDEKKRKKK
jgi:hypothetical protein